MMRISVGDTILRAWGFAGRRFLPLLGAGWLTAAFYAAAMTYLLTHLGDAMLVSPRPDPGSFNNFALFYMFCIVLVTALANAAMSVPMLRESFAPGGEWKSVYFSIALREWSLFSNTLLLYVLIIGIVSAIAFAGSVGIAVSLPMIGNQGVWQGIALAPVMITVLAIVALAAGLILATRFGFFLATTATVDTQAHMLQAWGLSRGNFWRILGLGLGLIVPVIVLAMAAIWAVCGAAFADALNAVFSSPHENTPLFQMIHDHAEGIAIVCAVALLVLNAIFAGASQIAYAKVAEADVTVDDAFGGIAVPAYAMAAPATPEQKIDELPRLEPKFAQADASAKAAEVPAMAEGAVDEVTPVTDTEASAVEEVAPLEKSSESTAEAEVLDEAVAAEAAIAVPEAETHSGANAIIEEAPEATALPEEEPLAAHTEELPAMDPLSHAAPAAPDPSGEPPATPLPSFVKTQPSQTNEPSEAA